MLKAIIVDDEDHCIERLKKLIENNFDEDVSIDALCKDVDSAFEAIQQKNPDLVFLDIQIQNETGFDLLRKLPSNSFKVVFTTAYEKYAIKAFKFSAVDYLLKPIDLDDLKDTIKKIKYRADKQQKENLDVLIENFNTANQKNTKIAIPTLNGFMMLKIQEIIRCQSDVNYTTIFTTSQKPITVAKTLKEFEGLLLGHQFFRVHNSHLVNLSFVRSYNKGKGGFLKLEDGEEIEVSSRRKDDFLVKLKEI